MIKICQTFVYSEVCDKTMSSYNFTMDKEGQHMLIGCVLPLFFLGFLVDSPTDTFSEGYQHSSSPCSYKIVLQHIK